MTNENGLIIQHKEDNNSSYKKDIFPPRKAFVYALPKISKGEPFLKPFSHTFLTLDYSTTALNKDWKDYEVEVQTISSDGERVGKVNGNETNIKRHKILHCYTGDFRGKGGTETVYVMTLDEPLNEEDHKSGKQIVYKIEDINIAGDVPYNLEGLLNEDSNTEIVLTDIDIETEKYDKAELSFRYAGQEGLTDKINFAMSKYSQIFSMQVKGKAANGTKINTQLKTEDRNMTPMLINFIETKDKNIIYLPWLDNDISLPFFTAKEISESVGTPLKDIKLDTKVIECIADMILVSFAYLSEFSFVKWIEDSKGRLTIDGNQYIGFEPIQIAAMVNKDEKKVLNSIYEKYIVKNPQDETSGNVRALKQVIAALSRELKTNNAIGGGKTNFHKVYLPFYINISSDIHFKEIDKTTPLAGSSGNVKTLTVDLETTKITLKSKYFVLATDSNGKTSMSNRHIKSSSETNVIQLDSKMLLPPPEDIIAPMNKLPKPEDIDIRSAKDMQYLGYIFIDNDKVQEFYGNRKNFNIVIKDNQTITSKISTKYKTKKEIEREFIKNIDIYNNRNGTKVDKDATLSLDYFPERTPEALFIAAGISGKFVSGAVQMHKKTEMIKLTEVCSETGAIQLFKNGIKIADENKKLTDSDSDRKWLKNILLQNNMFSDEKEIVSIKQTSFKRPQVLIANSYSYGGGTWVESDTAFTATYAVEVSIKTYKIDSGFKYLVSTGQALKEDVLDRKAIFDKVEWERLIDHFTMAGSKLYKNFTVKLNEPVEVEEIIIHTNWSENIDISFKNISNKIKSWNSEDEQIMVDKIIFK